MPTDIHVKIFSYLTLKEQANSSRVCKKFKATLIKSNALDYSNLFENFINQIITSLDKNRFLTLIGELKACIVSHPLNRSHSLLNLKENLESLIFPLAEILKKIPYEDLSFDFIHQNVCMPMEFTTKLFRVIGSLKSEILFNQKLANEKVSEDEFMTLIDIAETFIFNGYENKGIQLFAQYEAYITKNASERADLLLKQGGERIVRALALKKQFNLINNFSNILFDKNLRVNIAQYQSLHLEDSDTLLSKLDELYCEYNLHVGIECEEKRYQDQIISQLTYLDHHSIHEIRDETYEQLFRNTLTKNNQLKILIAECLAKITAIIDVLISRNQFEFLSNYFGQQPNLCDDQFERTMVLNSLINHEISLNYLGYLADPKNCYFMIYEILLMNGFFEKAVEIAKLFDQKTICENFSMEAEIKETWEEIKFF